MYVLCSRTILPSFFIIGVYSFMSRLCLRYTTDLITQQILLERSPVPPCWVSRLAAPPTTFGWSSSLITTTPQKASNSTTAVRTQAGSFYRTVPQTDETTRDDDVCEEPSVPGNSAVCSQYHGSSGPAELLNKHCS